MAEKGGNGSPLPRGKAAAPLKQGRTFSFSYFSWSYFEARLKQSDPILRMLASESGFVEEKVPTSLNANEKSSAEQKSGKKKVSFGSLKSSGKASFDIPTAKVSVEGGRKKKREKKKEKNTWSPLRLWAISSPVGGFVSPRGEKE
ncbi:hypothetical protein BHE74_00059681 [Ensete ventricosum]|nr:hypothetical protein BHE74_00059681 [Ensete ventricosum]